MKPVKKPAPGKKKPATFTFDQIGGRVKSATPADYAKIQARSRQIDAYQAGAAARRQARAPGAPAPSAPAAPLNGANGLGGRRQLLGRIKKSL